MCQFSPIGSTTYWQWATSGAETMYWSDQCVAINNLGAMSGTDDSGYFAYDGLTNNIAIQWGVSPLHSTMNFIPLDEGLRLYYPVFSPLNELGSLVIKKDSGGPVEGWWAPESGEFDYHFVVGWPGCTDPGACNFDNAATISTGCQYIAAGACNCAGNTFDALGVCGGSCPEDADSDGVCDDVDECVGAYDACGVCNGPGEIYECGCADIPEGDCDCGGNVTDECGICGGSGIQEEACDCNGNQLDALGVCGGSCALDTDGNGVCDDSEIPGCASWSACNFDFLATQDDGSCEWTSCDCNDPGACNYNVFYETGYNQFAIEQLIQSGELSLNSIFELVHLNGYYNPQNPVGCDYDYCDCNNVNACNYNLSEPNAGSAWHEGAEVDEGYNGSIQYTVWCEFESCDCEDSEACNYNSVTDGASVWVDAGGTGVNQVLTCDFNSCTCEEVFACNYGNSLGQSGILCDFESCDCLNENACNYDVVTIDGNPWGAGLGPISQEMCDFESCDCEIPTACNYNWVQSGSNLDNYTSTSPNLCDFSSCDCEIPSACNYDQVSSSSNEFGYTSAHGTTPGITSTCSWCTCEEASTYATLDITKTPAVQPGLFNYKFYVRSNASFELKSVLGLENYPIQFQSSAGVYNSVFNDSWSSEGMSPSFMGLFPDLADDSFAAFGLEGPADIGNGESDPIALSANQEMSFFSIPDAQSMVLGAGEGWATEVSSSSSLSTGNDQGILIAQITTSGEVSGQVNVLIQQEGDLRSVNFTFNTQISLISGAEGSLCGCMNPASSNYNPDSQEQGASVCLPSVAGCVDPMACNFSPGATESDDTCHYPPAPEHCDCDGNMLDAVGVCGGQCDADLDSDGICDDVDPCVGELDSCGICGGAGAIYPCGCTDIPEGHCNCQGQLDANANGICDELEVPGCTDPEACNFDSNAISDDGSCEFCSCQLSDLFKLEITELPEVTVFGVVKQFWIHVHHPLDQLVAVFGDELRPLEIYSSEGIFNSMANPSWNSGGVNPWVFGFFPDLQFDSFATIGLSTSVETSLMPGASLPLLADDAGGSISAFFADNDSQHMMVNDEVGASWFILGSPPNSLGGADLKILIAQVTTNGIIHGQVNTRILLKGNSSEPVDVTFGFDGIGIFEGFANHGDDGTNPCGCTDHEAMNFSSDAVHDDSSCFYALSGCTNPDACNFEPAATEDDGGCIYQNAQACDCYGNQLDVIGICGGHCVNDLDEDGICDDEDPCVGSYDACGLCNGPGAVYDCGCSEISAGDCDCDSNQLDALGECGGDCAADADADGICDDLDDCVGAHDECGICNGPGAIYECGCANITEGDCDCDGNQLDALDVCGGSCTADADNDGICDDVDDCVGAYGTCGLCNGPGEIFDCGCGNIPSGDCDCDGNQLDALGICGGECAQDLDQDGICDDVDDCVGAYDACEICNGPGEIYECGCTGIPEEDCDCDGHQLDGLGVCGGACAADADSDGICDDVDECVGSYDACGICNGPGEVYECGCAEIPEGDCDCVGNQLDALGVCGGACAADADSDGICDEPGIGGCAYAAAINYNPEATFDDGTCSFLIGEEVCLGDLDGDLHVGIDDILIMLSLYNTSCEN